MRNRSLPDHQDMTRELRYLLDLARISSARSTRHRAAPPAGQGDLPDLREDFDAHALRVRGGRHDQGANVTYLDPAGSQIGHKESLKDTARVLGRMYDAIEYRGFKQEIVEDAGQYAGVPVFNGLTDEYHPTQMLADVMTMREHSDKPLAQIATPTWATRATTWATR